MSAGRVPEDHTSGLTGGPQPRPGSADAVEAAFPAAPVPRFPRLQALAGLTVRGRDDRTVGRVRDIYQQDAGGGLAAITVVPRQLSSRSVLVPAAAIESLPPFGAQQDPARRGPRADAGSRTDADPRADAGPRADAASEADAGSSADADPRADARPSSDEDPVVRLRVDAATAKAGTRPPETAHVTPQDLREAAEALGLSPEAEAPSAEAPSPAADASAPDAPGSAAQGPASGDQR